MSGDLAIPAITADEARQRLDRVRSHVSAVADDLAALYHGRAWLALGLPSWDALCDVELGGVRIALPRDERAGIAADLRSEGLSTRAIGAALGVHHSTVADDLAGVGNPTPDRVVGHDGKTYPAHVTQTTRTTETSKVEHDVDLDTGEVLVYDRAWAVALFPVLDVPDADDADVITIAQAVLTHHAADRAMRAENGAKWLAAQARRRGDAPRPPGGADRHHAAATVISEMAALTVALGRGDLTGAWDDADGATRARWAGTVRALGDQLAAVQRHIDSAATLRRVQ